MSSAKLFSPVQFKKVVLHNRVVVSPMCMYNCEDGFSNDFHLVHLGQFALRGAGLVIMEATGVTPEGRITLGCNGIYKDEHVEGLARITKFVHLHNSKIGIQLAHAGRKASTVPPPMPPNTKLPLFEIIGPSAVPFAPDAQMPREMTLKDIEDVKEAFVKATQRADLAGFDVIEIHAAHGYLLHSFLSPVANHRKDHYGGSFENRTRLVKEVVQAVRAAWPVEKPLFIRFSATDWFTDRPADSFWTLEQTKRLCQELSPWIDLFDISSGAIGAGEKIPWRNPEYQTSLARQIKAHIGNAAGVGGVGQIKDAKVAEELLNEGNLDLVVIGREFLRNPNWVMTAAQEMGVDVDWLPQYQLAKPKI